MVAYCCSPYKGSDWRVGWGRAVRAAERFDVWVMTSVASQMDIERYFEQNRPIPNLTFIYVEFGSIGRLLARIPISYFYTNPFSYRSWQRQVYRCAQALHTLHEFDLTHHVNLIGYREPGHLWRLNVPFIWGPIGGTQSCPWRFLASAGAMDMMKEGFRTAANWAQLRFSRKVRQALDRAAVVLVANSDGKRAFSRYRPDVIQLLETGLDDISPREQKRLHDGPLRILWSGEVQFRKALHLLLAALAQINGAVDFEVRILGRGPNLEKSRALAERLGVSQHCRFLGWLPLDQAMEQSNWADVFVFTSLRDTSGNVMLEAMSRGVPVITFDHQGAGDIVTESSGIKIPITTPADAVCRFRDAIVEIGRNRELLKELSQGALDRARYFLWSRNAGEMSDIYAQVLEKDLLGGERLTTAAENVVWLSPERQDA
jgi:glycosyltransferase involved in cell wall biosynthesis